VQADLQLPAPAIAVAGSDGYQLWFALAQPVPAGEATSFLSALRTRYLADLAPDRVRMVAEAQASLRVPPYEIDAGRWSAFVAPDLAALFSEETWLDLPPGADAQADLLSRLQCASPAEWSSARERVAPAATTTAAPDAPRRQDPRQFLLDVMNDRAVDLRLRIEAAKALLP
jgi:hypothetical protein